MNLAKTQTIMARRFDNCLGGLIFNEFLILLYIERSPDNKMRRTDLADALGLTQSAVTRILLPMEKVRVIKRETNENDGRVSFVAITNAGKEKLDEAMMRMMEFCEENISKETEKKIEKTLEFLPEIIKILK